MPSFSQVIQVGHLTRDPELTYTPSEIAITKFALATNYGPEDKKEVCFIEVVVFGKQAESTAAYLSKGSAALIEGRLAQENWEDKNTGAKRSKHKIIANRIVFLGNKPEKGSPSREPGDEQDLPF